MKNKPQAQRATFTKASTPEGVRKQRAAIIRYYAQKKEGKNPAKAGKEKQ